MISPNIFGQGLRVVYAQAERARTGDLLSQYDWGRLEEQALEPGTVVGTDAIIRGMKAGVTHALHLRVYGEGSHSNGANPQGFLTDMRIYAAEGEFDDATLDEGNYGCYKGMGTLMGFVIFTQDGAAEADFSHGTGPSADPNVQQRLEEIVGVFGLPATIIGPDLADQYFDYDDAAMQDLIRNLPHAHEL